MGSMSLFAVIAAMSSWSSTEAVAPVVTGLSTTSVAVEGVTSVTVKGSGFGAAGSAAFCRITSRGCGAFCSGDFGYHGTPGNQGNASKPPANPSNQFPGSSQVKAMGGGWATYQES